MTLYRHYKNLPYRMLDIVKHSETMEDLVLYETLYDHQGGRLWVRPKAMFFETVEVQGQKQPRFAKAELIVKSYTSLTDDVHLAINRIGELCFDTWNPEDLNTRTTGKLKLNILIGEFDGKPVGFKIGYELSKDTFYSWLGGVDPNYHRFGFASRLAEEQHEWAIGSGFKAIQTKCFNFNLPMLKLNLKSGFLVIDTELTEGGLKLVLEKRIRESLV
ncbi:MAG: GNAT family N-acetyltransferase [Proteobacteria bacterium]|nr:MAG: GNAT family N-acetyltransferase [Pseudomonadota bacterium]